MSESAPQQPPAPSKGKARKTADPSAPVRKRRKRTVVSGAPDDCFTCSKRGARCDRRRPYCSQCLELGRECSGYKTTLTWGLGVASRGKLRGQKLPVMDSSASGSGKPPGKSSQAATTAPLQNQKTPPQDSKPSSAQITDSALPDGMVFTNSDTTGLNSADSNIQHQSTLPNAYDSFNATWTMDMPDPHTWSSVPAIPPQISGLPLPSQPLASNRLSPSMASVASVASVGSEGSIPYRGFSPETTFASPIWPVAKNWAAPHGNSPTQEEDEEYARTNSERSILWDAGHSPSYSQLLLARSVGRTPRLKYLIGYFTEVIAPMIVAFDSPTNPFKTHVFRLAQESEALQEAIATLSTSNLRQRRERNHMSTERTLPARMSSMAHRALTDEAFQERYGISVPEGYAREENHHRAMAVKALNADLADPHRRLSDSVLATLLVLCLFHGCDTGVAEFRTQFAGVTRLLAIRMRHSRVLTDNLKWFIRMFSWLDTLTATTNDRDVQLRGKCLDISSMSDGEWALENLAGCDGRLFKLISQLGRLNLLSQDQQPTESTRPADVSVPTTSLPPDMLFPGWASVTGPAGPGFQAGVDYGFSIPTPPPSSSQARKPSSPAFWTEWYSLRQRLESWRFDPPASTAMLSPPQSVSSTNSTWNPPTFIPEIPSFAPSALSYVAPENLQDVYQISECFRHAALLYCERLAEPSLPSRHPRIQHLVHLAMHCIRAVQSDVYLLWPLFIVGSECVEEDHRAVVRARCKDISKDSGFVNNISCLELLEKIWAEHSDESSYPVYPSDLDPPPVLNGGSSSTSSQAFRWSRVMQAKRGEGEYMVA